MGNNTKLTVKYVVSLAPDGFTSVVIETIMGAHASCQYGSCRLNSKNSQPNNYIFAARLN